MINLKQGDCLELMKNIPDSSVDLILCDPPYGTIKGMKLDGWNNNSNRWDTKLPTNQLFYEYERILREQGTLILFSQEPYTSFLRRYKYQNLNFIYPMIWIKDHFANPFAAKKAPVNYFEDINVFKKKYDRQRKNPLRQYSKKVLKHVGNNKQNIFRYFGNRKLDHFLRYNSMQFSLPTKNAYDKFTYEFKLNKNEWYLTYNQLKSINKKYSPTFNIKGKYLSNVLYYKKDYTRYHPTQKPIKLLECLIRTYTYKNDTVLDNTMGSGSTGVAAINLNRNFIGYETNNKYFNTASKRINEAKNNKSKQRIIKIK